MQLWRRCSPGIASIRCKCGYVRITHRITRRNGQLRGLHRSRNIHQRLLHKGSAIRVRFSRQNSAIITLYCLVQGISKGRDRWETLFYILLSLGSHSKQNSDEYHLTLDISFLHIVYLPPPHHIHRFVSLQRSPGRFKREGAKSWFDQPFDESMTLLYNIVEILDQDVSSQPSNALPSAFSSFKALGSAAFLSTVITRGVTV